MPKICLILVLVLIFSLFPSLTTAQELSTDASWGVQEGDIYTWTIDKFRSIFGPIEQPLFKIRTNETTFHQSIIYPYTVVSLMNVTEGDYISIEILRLGDSPTTAQITEMDLKLTTKHEEYTLVWNETILELGFIDWSLTIPGAIQPIIPIADRDYYKKWVAHSPYTQDISGQITHIYFQLQDNLLNITYKRPGERSTNVAYDITTGLLQHYKYMVEILHTNLTIEYEYTLVKPILADILPTPGYEYFLGITGLIGLLLITKRKRKSS